MGSPAFFNFHGQRTCMHFDRLSGAEPLARRVTRQLRSQTDYPQSFCFKHASDNGLHGTAKVIISVFFYFSIPYPQQTNHIPRLAHSTHNTC